jgi:hypothetical protein
MKDNKCNTEWFVLRSWTSDIADERWIKLLMERKQDSVTFDSNMINPNEVNAKAQ